MHFTGGGWRRRSDVEPCPVPGLQSLRARRGVQRACLHLAGCTVKVDLASDLNTALL
jgi:hypothetical protein